MVDQPVFESWVERVIREAQDSGKLDVAEGVGKPIPDLSRPYDPSWWARRWIEAERSRERAAELSRSVEKALPRILARESIDDIRDGLELLNQRISEHNADHPSNELPLLDVRLLIARRAGRRRR